jgi:hypothetical protein
MYDTPSPWQQNGEALELKHKQCLNLLGYLIERLGGVIELNENDVANTVTSLRDHVLEVVEPVPGAHGWVLRVTEHDA